ncbi:uncharacterized protein LOC143668272 [Tamandua tetradactyla]|uniref:uncharacterized protein LOC143668272 n=1 Tax=Tamandua tetradactyla TaxID=48850 RepID=UPI0040542B3A
MRKIKPVGNAGGPAARCRRATTRSRAPQTREDALRPRRKAKGVPPVAPSFSDFIGCAGVLGKRKRMIPRRLEKREEVRVDELEEKKGGKEFERRGFARCRPRKSAE